MPPVEANQTNQVWSVCFRPDGDQVLVAVADLIFVYKAETGELLNKIKGKLFFLNITFKQATRIPSIALLIPRMAKDLPPVVLTMQSSSGQPRDKDC
jgi:hypothetical protein